MSILDHISNRHTFPENQKYKSCPHPPLDGSRAKAWLPAGSLVRTRSFTEKDPLITVVKFFLVTLYKTFRL